MGTGECVGAGAAHTGVMCESSVCQVMCMFVRSFVKVEWLPTFVAFGQIQGGDFKW